MRRTLLTCTCGLLAVGIGRAALVSWSPDGTKLAYQQRDGAIMTVNAADGQTAQWSAPPAARPTGQSDVAWSPDGRRIATRSGESILVCTQGGGSVVWPDKNAQLNMRKLELVPELPHELHWSPDGTRLGCVCALRQAPPSRTGRGGPGSRANRGRQPATSAVVLLSNDGKQIDLAHTAAEVPEPAMPGTVALFPLTVRSFDFSADGHSVVLLGEQDVVGNGGVNEASAWQVERVGIVNLRDSAVRLLGPEGLVSTLYGRGAQARQIVSPAWLGADKLIFGERFERDATLFGTGPDGLVQEVLSGQPIADLRAIVPSRNGQQIALVTGDGLYIADVTLNVRRRLLPARQVVL